MRFLKDVVAVAAWTYAKARDKGLVDGKGIIRKAIADPIMERMATMQGESAPMADEPDIIVYRTSAGRYVTPSMIYKDTLKCPYCTDETKDDCTACGGTRMVPLSRLMGTQFVEACEISNEKIEEVITHLDALRLDTELEPGEKALLKLLLERRGEWWTQ